MPFTSKWPPRKLFGKSVNIKTLNFDKEPATEFEGPDYYPIGSDSNSSSSSCYETLTEESYDSTVPKQDKPGIFSRIRGFFKRKKAPAKSQTIVSIVGKDDENVINTNETKSQNVKIKKEELKNGVENEAYNEENIAKNALQTRFSDAPCSSATNSGQPRLAEVTQVINCMGKYSENLCIVFRDPVKTISMLDSKSNGRNW
ncbi:hypothetical protein CAEBREN_14430 [Caenorhabditis brenneri]|uniref:Uncharacterized protein n=1 Tax=Caenorhabditis brenneri TaxID=135651 RepID=G0MAF0_CAEBE|nr:hypothetical protein CAEBREN_14430 [Caenorhabditis brenneri]